MKKLFFILVVITYSFSFISCKGRQDVESKLYFSNQTMTLENTITNHSDSNYYFSYKYLESPMLDENKSKIHSFSLNIEIDSVFENQDVKILKKIAWQNYKNTHREMGFLVVDSSLSDNNLSDIVFFVKKKSSINITYKVSKFIKGKRYEISFLNWIPTKNSKRDRVMRKFYSYGKIGNYYPYTKNIESKPIIVGF